MFALVMKFNFIWMGTFTVKMSGSGLVQILDCFVKVIHFRKSQVYGPNIYWRKLKLRKLPWWRNEIKAAITDIFTNTLHDFHQDNFPVRRCFVSLCTPGPKWSKHCFSPTLDWTNQKTGYISTNKVRTISGV